jgi:CzcA family heavy metal efflux pump
LPLNLARFALDRAKLIVFVAVVLALLGVGAYAIAPRSIFPQMTFARIDVVVDAGDLPPDRVRIAVTVPLERAFQTLPALQRLRANSAQGAADIVLDFDPHTDSRTDLQIVNQALTVVRSSIPAATNIDALIVDPNAEPVVSYALTSRVLSQAALRQFIQTRVLPAFAGTAGLGRISAIGGPPIEYLVDLNAATIAAVGLSATDVANAIADANDVTSVGSTERYNEQYVLLVDAALHDARSIAAIGVPLKSGLTIPVGSLGRVRLTTGMPTNQAATNGTHSVMLNAYMLAGADAVTLAREVAVRLDQVRPTLPVDVTVTKYWDQTRLIVDSQDSLRDAILLGAVLAVIVIFLFLRNLRMTLVAATIIPLAMAIAIFALEASGQSLNLMSVGGLAVAVGLIIDDAIVVIEAIARELAEYPGRPAREVVIDAASRLAGAMAASTATTVVVFIPLGLLTGITGFFFRALAFTLAAALIVSLLLALLVTPILAAAFVRRNTQHIERPDRLATRYRPLLSWALDHRGLVFAGAAVILATTFIVLARLPSDFLPNLDEGEFEIKYTLPPGTNLATSDAIATTMEHIVMRDPAVAVEGRVTGIDTNGFTPTLPTIGTLRIALVTGKRDSYDVVSDRLRDAITARLPVVSLDLHQLLEDQINDLSGAPEPVEIAITGPDQDHLIALASETADAIGKVPGIVDTNNGVVYDEPTLRFAPRSSRLAALGITPGDFAGAIGARTQGSVAAEIPANETTTPVRVRVAGGPIDASSVGDLTLFTHSGATRAGSLASVEPAATASEINDENGRRIVRVTANIAGASLSGVVAGIRRALATVPYPPGYSAEIGGAYQTQQASFREFANVIGIAIVLVFTVMLAAFGSFRLPLVILGAIPLALIGVALGLALTGTPINVSSFMGLLLLIGIVVKNGILLIDVANRRQAAGDDVRTALLVAGSTRVRPIVMTTLATIGGLFPLALGIGSGAEMEKPLAIAVIGGLSTATAFTLILIPVLYAVFTERRVPRRGVALTTATLFFLAVAFLSSPAGAAEPAQRFAAVSLLDAEAAAVGASPDVRAAQAAVNGAQAALDQARGTTGLAATTGYAQAPQGSPAGTIASRVASVGAQLTLGDVFNRDPLVAQASAALRATTMDRISAERNERMKVAALYFAALKARAISAAQADAVASAQRFVAAAQTRFASGDAPRLDLIRAQVALAKAQADNATGRAADANATDALAREIDVTVGALGALAIDSTPVSAPADPATAVARAIAVRGDLQSATENVRAAQAGVDAARRSLIPPITVAGGYDRGTDSGFPISGPTASVEMVIPLGGSLSARVREQQALVDAAVAKRNGVLRTIGTDVAAAARDAAASVEVQAATAQALVAAQAEVDAATLGYQNGASTSLELSSARSAFVQAMIDDLTARSNLRAALATLALEMQP